MKKVKRIMIGIAAAILLYLAFSFGHWNINAGQWDKEFRGLCAMLMLLAIVMSVVTESEVDL